MNVSRMALKKRSKRILKRIEWSLARWYCFRNCVESAFE